MALFYFFLSWDGAGCCRVGVGETQCPDPGWGEKASPPTHCPCVQVCELTVARQTELSWGH